MYSDEEMALTRECYLNNCSDAVIAERLNALARETGSVVVRTAAMIRNIRFYRHLTKRHVAKRGKEAAQQTDDDRPFMAADLAFADAMRRAIYARQEIAVEGIFKDFTPFVGRFIHPEPRHSGCTSAAALCAEIGSKTRDPAFL